MAPLWVRVLVRLVEVLMWALTFGYVKRIIALERLLGYSPGWNERDKAEESIRTALLSGMGAARRLAQPWLRIETEFSKDNGGDDSDVLTPRTATAYEETLRTRLRVNARIRNCLRAVSLAELEAPLTVSACTWNVDQQPPPADEKSFLTWLLGYELTEEIKHFREHKQRVMEHGGTVPTMPTPSATSTMRDRKVNGTTGSIDFRQSFSLTPDSPAHSTSTRRTSADPLVTEWEWLEKKFPDLFLISLQEVEMTGRALVRESTQRRWEWTDAIIDALSNASDRNIEYKKVQVVQLVGLVLIVLVQEKHVDYVSHVRLSLTRTGALSVLGNKGSVAMRATIYGKRFLFISAHFVAHAYNEKRRTSNYRAALKDIRFAMPAWSDDESEVLQTFMNATQSAGHGVRNSSVACNSAWERLFRFRSTAFNPSFSNATETRVLDEHDYVFFLGDLNSRLHAVDGKEIREAVAAGEYDYLLCHDELRQLMVSGEAFDGFQEQWISFPPTYKFDRNSDVYDTSRKRREPAWCDRVLFRVLETSGLVAAEASPANASPRGSPKRRSVPGNGENSTSATFDSTAGIARKPSFGGDWVTLEELQQTDLAQQAETQMNEATSTASSFNTSPAAEVSGEDSADAAPSDFEEMAATLAAEATQKSFDPVTQQRQSERRASAAPTLSRIPSHAVWEQKDSSQTFSAVRRPGAAEASANGFAVRFPMVANHVNPLDYTHVATLRQSDHRPVRARFEVKVIALEPGTVDDIVESVRQVINDEELK